jgi:hypothetical protein
MSTFPLEWFHGSPLRLEVLRVGSTITPLRDLARVFSHKPALVSLDEVEGVLQLKHSGSRPGWLYRVLDVTESMVYPHPRSTMPAGYEWLTRVDLRLECIEPTTPRPDEFLDAAEIVKLRGG